MVYLISLLISFILMLILGYYLDGQDLLAPPVVMIGVFIFSTTIALSCAKEWRIDYSFEAFWYLTTGVLSFSIPYTLIYLTQNGFAKNSDTVQEQRRIVVSSWKIIFIIAVDILIFILFRNAMIRLVGGNVKSLGYVYRTLTTVRGGEYVSGGIRMLIKIIDASAYTCLYIFVSNVIVYKNSLLDNFLYLVPSIIYCVKCLMSGGRLDVLRLLSFFFVVSYLVKHQKVGWKRNITFKYLILSIFAILTVLPLFYYLLRFTGRSTTRTMLQSLSTYIGGSIQHFNQYVQKPNMDKRLFGDECFTPILNILGRARIINYYRSVHLEFRRLGVTSGNVYTFFRRPLHDFGLVGMYVFTVFVSIAFSVLYLFKIKFKKCSLQHDLDVIIYAYLFYWIIFSSVDQYSVTIISVQTILTIIAFALLWLFMFCFEIRGSSIYIYRWKTKKNWEN